MKLQFKSAAITFLLLLTGCKGNDYLILKDGNGKFVTCFFQSGDAYQHLVFEVNYDKKLNKSDLFFISSSEMKGKKQMITEVLSFTENRLSIYFKNKNEENILLNVFFNTRNFELKPATHESTGICKNKV
ncbi:MAG: hypothetical protein EXR08_04285 [Alphaproteobacteria bacterium]|nr:hypothetical protein [Alphaproteobacteria bacterium]